MTHKVDDWHGLYSEGWQGEITPDAFSHPAKFSRALIRRIYDHAAAEGWVEPGAVVVDPFGGVALGALDAMRLGLAWIGCELEPKFVDLGRANIALWAGRYGPHLPGWGCAHLLQGDSRQLAAHLAGAGLCVSSPPYAHNTEPGRVGNLDRELALPAADRFGRSGWGTGYGNGPGQLGAMREGDLSLAISSPPYAAGTVHGGNGIDPEKLTGNTPGRNSQALTMDGYGTSVGNLGAMRESDFSLAISSPPYADGCAQQGTDKNANRMEGTAFAPARYDLAVSSPPFAQQQTGGGLAKPDARYIDGTRIGTNCGYQNQGTTPGNLASMTVSSPPYAGSQVQQSHGQSWREELTEAPGSWRDLGTGYGATPGQLGTMPEGEPATGNRRRGPGSQHEATLQAQLNYNPSAGNLGAEERDTFWTAARTIVEQTYQVLKPGGHAVFVVKAFVRNKARVDFPGQWRQLCEAVGFVTLHEHRAWLVEERGTQIDLFGNHHTKTVERKSFFRRLAESKGSPRIDWETVYCMVKPD